MSPRNVTRLVYVTVGVERDDSRQHHPSDGRFKETDFAVLSKEPDAQRAVANLVNVLREAGFNLVSKVTNSRDVDNCAVLTLGKPRAPKQLELKREV